MANKRRYSKRKVKDGTKIGGRFKTNVINITGEYDESKLGAEAVDKNSRSITVYAKGYYKSHKKSIDRIIDKARNETGRFQYQSNEEVFVSQVEDLLDTNMGGQASFTKKSTLNDKVQGLLNEMQGIDPELNKIKREADFRNEAGFKDLRKLNKRLAGKETSYKGPNNVVGYYDISNSDYVIAHRLDYTWSRKSPQDIYEYVERSTIGLPRI